MRAWTQQKQDDRRAVRWLWVSVLLHIPLTPLGQLFGLAALVSRCSEPPAPVEELRGIPIELLEQPAAERPAPAEVEPPRPAETASETVMTLPKKPKPRRHASDELDAGVASEDSGTDPIASLDASAPIAKLDDAGTDAGVAVAQAQTPAESLSAATHGLADSNANIQLQIYMSRVRQQPLGAELGRILKSVYQWRDFFAEGGLDPVKDLDQIWLFGPQLRDSSQIAAFLKHNVRAPRMKGAIDALVKKSGKESEWLKDTKYPAAHAFADRAQRTIVMYPSQVVAVVPPGVEKVALSLPGLKWPAAKGDEMVTATVKTPYRALLGTGFPFPKTIRSASIKIFADEDGGARIEAVLEDESAAAAQNDAKRIQKDVDSVTLASNWLLSGSRFAEPAQASVEQNKIEIALKVTRSQAERILTLAEAALTPEGRHAAREAVRSALADAGTRRIAPSGGSASIGSASAEKPVPAPPTPSTAPLTPTPPVAPTLPSTPLPPSAPKLPEPGSSVP